MTTGPTDRIEKRVTIRAPRSTVWKALTDSQQFGEWFGVALNGPFTAGAPITGRITNPGYDHLTVEFQIDRIEPERYFSYRWHPFAIDPAVDYSQEPTTLVEFTLEASGDTTRLTIVESGFDRIPEHRRAEAYRSNDGGWTIQSERVAQYATRS